VGAVLILTATTGGDGEPAKAAAEAATVQGPYLGLAAALFLIALAFSRFKLPVIAGTNASSAPAEGTTLPSVWSYRHLVFGAVAIFTYVGAEVSIGSFLVNFMSRPEIGGLTESAAGKYLSLYWGGAMVGRFIGAAVLRKVKPGYAADHIGILLSFIVPLVCYLYIIHYGLKGHQAGAAATGSR